MGSPLSASTPRRAALRAAFTLIEILVVIAIIAILAALIFPAISGAIRSGRQATSVSNLKNWAAAFHASWTDNDGEMPSDGAGGDSLTTETSWYNRMPPKLSMPALKNVGGDIPRLGTKSIWINQAAPVIPVSGVPFTYGYNDYLSNKDEPTMRFTRVVHPSKTVLMVEKRPDSAAAGNPGNITAYFGAKDTTDPAAICDILFVDGHVSPVPYKMFTDPTSVAATNEDDLQQAPFLWVPFVGATP